MGYYDNVNPTLLSLADVTASTVLEIGCGAGSFARAYKARNPGAYYVGIEYVQSEADQAKHHLDGVLCANVEEDETFHSLDKLLDGRSIDLLIIGDVLEHLWQPEKVLRNIHERMSPNGRAEICMPNIAHWSTLMRLLKGDWTYADNGLMDRTHMRFYTRDTTRKLLEDTGWTVNFEQPRTFNRDRGIAHAKAFAKISKELNFDPNVAAQNMLPLQWVFSATKSENPKPISIKAIGIGTKIDALSKIRLMQPLNVLKNSGEFTPNISIANFDSIPDGDPGIFLTYRLHPESNERREHINQKCREGWLFIHDVDDHPEYLAGQKKNDFWSIKSAHAITVSTDALAQVCKKWNPNVFVVNNQIPFTSDDEDVEKSAQKKPILFFGALNREEEWKSECADIVDFLIKRKEDISCSIVHEPSLFKALNNKADAVFHPTQTYENFINLLAQSDFALLPLFENEFNECKSDLKVIECLAHGVIPICSSYTAQQTSVPRKFLTVVGDSKGWTGALNDLLKDPIKVKKQKFAGLEYIRKNRMWSHHGTQLANLYTDLFKNQSELEKERLKRLAG